MGRAGLTMGGLALVTVALSMLIPFLGWFILAPLTALIIGAGAGWWASKLLGYGTAGRGAGAGALAGLGALLGSMIGLGIFLAIAGNNEGFQLWFQQLLETTRQQNPDQEIGDVSGAAVAVVTTVLGGGCIGLVNFFLSLIGGLFAGLVYGRNRGPAPAAPVGSYPPGQVPSFLDAPAPQPPGVDQGARIYPDDQRRE